MKTRFSTTRALFDEFPTLRQAARVLPGEEEPVAFVRQLAASGKLRDAVAICAYILRKREAVAWTCRCLRSKPELTPPDDQAILAAEAWVARPDEEARDIAHRWGQAGDHNKPTTWAAYAAGFTSGNLAVTHEGPIRVPPHLTAESARVALVLAETQMEMDEAQRFLKGCLEAALRALESEPDQS
ncbi:MAG: hypothetical protein JNK46_00825 [Methylobacteriaceae bacterium]|nr:hypothetical protein [Methylobacteriaceae bacterium]